MEEPSFFFAANSSLAEKHSHAPKRFELLARKWTSWMLLHSQNIARANLLQCPCVFYNVMFSNGF